MLSSSWDGRPFTHNRHGPKRGGAVPLSGERELGPHLTQCSLGRGLSLYQVASWSIQPFGHNKHGPKIGKGLCPFGEGAGSPSNTMWPGWGLPPYRVVSWCIQPFGHNRPPHCSAEKWRTCLQSNVQQAGTVATASFYNKYSSLTLTPWSTSRQLSDWRNVNHLLLANWHHQWLNANCVCIH